MSKVPAGHQIITMPVAGSVHVVPGVTAEPGGSGSPTWTVAWATARAPAGLDTTRLKAVVAARPSTRVGTPLWRGIDPGIAIPVPPWKTAVRYVLPPTRTTTGMPVKEAIWGRSTTWMVAFPCLEVEALLVTVQETAIEPTAAGAVKVI